ncbi:Ni/Fe hydrogenase subunit alpha [Geomonas nitrogeniifigens]|uniref:Ni/Fe hydrogenase subunit alpha n=1 Tax=Geomonas diazotrophica TaxID=2843197 RepID=A0ABX8JUW7_9BACT|nr:Ni/Fe hydrogenase subunit alpha [Geomonas nitrogeniifigens]QWV99210.1 Ni/Fe hydrogenase subunit alpha [Geomonas nitrogeniifigens]QXE88379.1 Ni/Fe hydrogenase subunit alpha [Geomonas nitrogeniifigens]
MGSVVEIAPLTRLEGHGSVRVYREGRRVERVELQFIDSPRLFEALLLGKSFAEVPEIICRICALCSTVHKVTALLAVEDAFGVEVSEVTALTRELMLQAGMIQDHALHLYCLVLPDLLGVRGVAELARVAPDLLKTGLAIKKVGNQITETAGGRLIHPVNIRLGGLGRSLTRNELARLRDELQKVLPAAQEAHRLFNTPFPFPELPTPDFLALQPAEHPLGAQACSMVGRASFPLRDYRQHIEETVLDYSNAKLSRVHGKEATVGALARLNLHPDLEGGAGALFKSHKQELVGKDMRGNNLAQAIEMYHATERALRLIDRLIELGPRQEETAAPSPRAATGCAACEAPRGVLIHSYSFDSQGICTMADVITPTALNQGALARDLLALARGMEGEETNRMTTALERLIRCYDPCISCSVHVLSL